MESLWVCPIITAGEAAVKCFRLFIAKIILLIFKQLGIKNTGEKTQLAILVYEYSLNKDKTGEKTCKRGLSVSPSA
jgi:hypothetical protein